MYPVSPSLFTRITERLFHASPNGVLIYQSDPADAVGNSLTLVLVNATAERSFGPSPDLANQLPPDTIRQVLRTGESYRQEMKLYPVGPLTPVFYDVSAVRMDDCVAVFYSDNTERKQLQAKQEEQAELLRTIVENGKVGMTLFDVVRDEQGTITDFEYVFTNSVNATNTGRTVAEMTGNRLLRLFPGIVDTPFFSTIIEAANAGDTRQVVVPYFVDGISGWYDITFAGVGDQVLFTDLDVTKIKQAELEQQRQASFLTQLVDTSMSGIAVYKAVRDEQSQIVDFESIMFNPAAAAIMQESGDALYGQTMRQRFTDENYPGLFGQMVRLTQDEGTFRNEFYYISVDKWLDVLGTRLDDGFLLLFNDVTEQHQRRRDLEQANLELQRSNDNLQQFAYVASHDLQEPLRKIRAFGDILLGQYGLALGDAGADMIGRMQSAAGRMSTLVIDLLAYSRISTRRDSFQRVSLADLLTEVCDDLSLVISETGADVQIDSLPTVPGDALQLRQLFQNLLSNALKFRPPDQFPSVQITNRYVSATDLPSNVMTLPGDAPRFVEIAVTDNGIGFDDKYRDQIFQVFQRLHTRNQYSGTGVGLAICRKVVENHGGTIDVVSQLGEGTTFRVYLPG